MFVHKIFISLIILCIACITDVKYYKVYNSVILFGWLCGLIFSIDEGVIGIITWIGAVLFPIILLFFLFIIKGLGAGDIKLFSVISGLLGYKFGLYVIVISIFFGGAISLLYMLHSGIFLKRILLFIQYIKNSICEKKITEYYCKEKDGKEGIIPFTCVILPAFLLTLLILY